jgi:pilus assembly protein CpaF
VLIPPLALNGTCISIRKFNEQKHSLQQLAALGAMSSEMADVLNIIARCRVNVLISGGTGAGKTTLLNALSFGISPDERIITIEDAAELKLQQPHVVSIETRPANIEGAAAIGQRELLRNALRMRPDRIILGEVRGAEAFDMMQAMNTGHDGSMSTLHANTPHDALIRLENMLLMAEVNLPVSALRRQIASTLDVVVQVERMRDGKRRVVNITEVVGLEGDQYLTHDLFHFDYQQMDVNGDLIGEFLSTKILPRFSEKARYYQLESQLKQAMGVR